MARALRGRGAGLLGMGAGLAAGAVLVPALQGLSLEREAVAVAAGCARAGAAETAAARLEDGVARAGLAAGAVRLARMAGVAGAGGGGADKGGAEGKGEGVGGFWRDEAEAVRQLDVLDALALDPWMGWLAASLGPLRAATLSRMAALDAALQVGAPDTAARDDAMPLLVAALVDRVDAHRRDLVAGVLALASADRRALAGTAVAGGLLMSVLGASAWRRGGAAAVPAPRMGPAEVVPATPAPAAGLRVLLVEDNAMVRFSLEAMLADLGYAVTAAGTASEAMALASGPGRQDAAAQGPDVLVTDLGLPDLDGVALAGRLRARQPSLRVVVASGRPGEAPGMVWLQKPFGLEALRRAVEDSAAAAR